jgi:adenylate kinase family enzyme
MRLLLLTGIPGTGKTTMGCYLKDRYGFMHWDFEHSSNWPSQVKSAQLRSPDDFVRSLRAFGDLHTITWGFMPVVSDPYIHRLKQLGAEMIWFDGNRKAAREAFNRRGTVPENLLDLQLERINQDDIITKFNPRIVDTFDRNGNFLSKEAIARMLIGK